MHGCSQDDADQHFQTVANSNQSGRVNVSFSLGEKPNLNLKADRLPQGVVVFGDPFDGAPIKGYSGPIKTYCATGDDVCEGEFVITAAHLSYVGADTTNAVVYIGNLVES